MNGPIRAGGHILCESGWEPETSPAGRAAVECACPPAGEPTHPSAAEPMVESAREPDRVQCPQCKREFAVNKDGTLRKHLCVDIAESDVTFKDGDGDGGDTAAEGW